MQGLKQIVMEHYRRYPHLELGDLVKLVYQNEFAGGHLIADAPTSLARLEQEAKQLVEMTEDTVPSLFESIGNGLTRLNLARIGATLPLTTVNQFFVQTANSRTGSKQQFRRKLQALEELCATGLLPYSGQEVQQFVQAYQEQGYPALSHSTRYRCLYDPHYRVVDSKYALYFPVFAAIEELLRGAKQTVVAIDGRSAAGKGTLAKLLQGVYHCSVISMDHFFLQPAQRTTARLKEPGGNVDRERFAQEVLPNLGGARPFTYQIYDCQRQSFSVSAPVKPGRLVIIEGSYSQHPSLAKAYDLKVFLTIDQQLQRDRILRRNGPLAERFFQEWIPLEEHYFSSLEIRQKSDVIIAG